MSEKIIIDNNPKGEDYLYKSTKGHGYIHVDAAGASFRYSLKDAVNGNRKLDYRPAGLESYTKGYRTMGAKMGQLFAHRVIHLLDKRPSVPLNEAYFIVASQITQHLQDNYGYLDIPAWQREAWSFTHVHVYRNCTQIGRVGDVSTFLIDKDRSFIFLAPDQFHEIEGPIQKERIDIITNKMGHPHGSEKFFCLDYAGFTHNGKTYEGLVQNRLDMINKKGLWKSASGIFQAVIGLEDMWAKNAEITSLPTDSLLGVLTSSDGLFEKGRNYGLFDCGTFVDEATSTQGFLGLVKRVRTHECIHKGKVFPDDLSAIFYPLSRRARLDYR